MYGVGLRGTNGLVFVLSILQSVSLCQMADFAGNTMNKLLKSMNYHFIFTPLAGRYTLWHIFYP